MRLQIVDAAVYMPPCTCCGVPAPAWQRVIATPNPPRFTTAALTPPPPNGPGVYRVFCNNSLRVFYIGQTTNLQQRLGQLFHAPQLSNPHPCHRHYNTAYGHFPTLPIFCRDFSADYLDFGNFVGRLELEEQMIHYYGCNRKPFYKGWLSSGGCSSTPPMTPFHPIGKVVGLG